jgi:glutamate/tyrosine decarboxylase-like PLP-dependent enzyme
MTASPFADGIHALDWAWRLARDFVLGLPDWPAGTNVTAEALDRSFDEPLPEKGTDPADAIEEWFWKAEPGITGSPGPRNFGFVIGGATPAALAGDVLASAIDQNSGLWIASPAAAHTEECVLRWLKELFGLPREWAGSITSGATAAHLVGLGAARQWASNQLGFDAAADGLGGHPAIPVLSSTEIHASAIKSLSTLGFGRSSVRKLPAIDGALDVAALRDALSTIDGPVIVVANAAEVNTGAFDDLNAISDCCAAHPGGAWLHVDAAFGLYARLSDRTAHFLDGIEGVDSVCADAHKWLNVPYDSGFAFVRDEEILLRTFSTRAAYLDAVSAIGKDMDGYGPVFSTRFRALAMWCALKAYGREGYRAMVERCLDNAAAFGAWLDASPDTELLAPVNLNMVCWRYAPAGLDPERTDQFNRDAVTRIQRDGRVFLTPTTWQGKQAVRCAFDNWATSHDDVIILQETVRDIGQELLGTAQSLRTADIPARIPAPEKAKLDRSKPSSIKRIPVDSSLAISIGYDSVNEILEIEFTSGAIWQYIGVEEEVYQELMTAPSIGRYFLSDIKDVYEEWPVR